VKNTVCFAHMTKLSNIFSLIFQWNIAFNFQKPLSVTHIFHDSTSSGGIKNPKLLLAGAATLIWVLWTSRNDFFDNSQTKTYMRYYFK
jgi:hypothetical protein